jgi:16S rRNA (guanine1207-N2)-methyltransferase
MDDHYFSADPSVPFKRTAVHATVWGHELALTSGSGVFAQGRLDIGTAVLFRETEPPAGGTLLDLGCGYGAIGCALAVAVPHARVHGVDVNERAVLLANENAAALGVADRFRAGTPDHVPTDLQFDEIG